MDVLKSVDEFDASNGCALAVGVFDGFHLGHARVAKVAIEAARELGVRPCVMTFRPHPRTVLGDSQLDLVISVEHRLRFLERAGIKATLLIEFTPAFARTSAQTFVRDIARDALGARAIILGADARIGADRDADAEGVTRIAAEHGINAYIVEPVLVDGEPASSTRVRSAVHDGDLDLARRLLGRHVSVLGTVVHGQGIGRRLGYPTANLDIHREVRPPFGVYATWAHTEGKRLMSVTNVGYRPTFTDGESPERGGRRPDRLVEAHLLEPPETDYYDKDMELEFAKKLRDERRFGTDAELSTQIARDVEDARAALAEDASA